MSSLPGSVPSLRLVGSDILKLRRRRGMMVACGVLCIGSMIVAYGVLLILHASDPTTHGPAGGYRNYVHLLQPLQHLSEIAAALVAATAGAGDIGSGVFRNLVTTGRPHIALFASRIPAGLAVLLPIVALGYALTSVCAAVFASGLPLPDAGVMVRAGMWLMLDVTMVFLFGLGLASAIGSRSTSMGLLLALQLVVTPLIFVIQSLWWLRQFVLGIALNQLIPSGIAIFRDRRYVMTTGMVALVLVLWAVVGLGIGAWRTITRDA